MLSWRRHCGEVHRPRGERSHSPHAQPQLLPHHGLLRGSGLPAPVQIPEHIGEANRGYRLVVRTDDRIQSPHQYGVIEAIATAAIIQRLVAAIDANLIQPFVGSDPQPFTGRMAARPGYDPLVPRVWTIDVMID